MNYTKLGEDTLRRAVQSVNMDDLSQAVSLWLSNHVHERVIAVAINRLHNLRQRKRKEDAKIEVKKPCFKRCL